LIAILAKRWHLYLCLEVDDVVGDHPTFGLILEGAKDSVPLQDFILNVSIPF